MGLVFCCQKKVYALIISVIFIDVKLLVRNFFRFVWIAQYGGVVFGKKGDCPSRCCCRCGRNKKQWMERVHAVQKMGRSVTWVSEWKKTPPKNFPSPEEAARMCAILGVDPADILLEQADINKVTALLDAERPKKISPTKTTGCLRNS